MTNNEPDKYKRWETPQEWRERMDRERMDRDRRERRSYRAILLLQLLVWFALAVSLFIRHRETWWAWLEWSLEHHPNLTLAALVFVIIPLIGVTFHLTISKSKTK